MREFLGHMRDIEERVPPIVYEIGVIPGEADDAAQDGFDEEMTLCSGADIVLVPSEEQAAQAAAILRRKNRTQLGADDAADRLRDSRRSGNVTLAV